MNLKNMKVRLPMYLIGLFIMTIGIAISVKSNLGVSPVSSIPYTMTRIWGIEIGKATILFHIVLVLIQLIILRINFKLISLLQIPVGVVFGYFTTFCNYLASFFPDTDWGNAKNYNLTVKSNGFGYEKTAELIEILFKQKFSL